MGWQSGQLKSPSVPLSTHIFPDQIPLCPSCPSSEVTWHPEYPGKAPAVSWNLDWGGRLGVAPAHGKGPVPVTSHTPSSCRRWLWKQSDSHPSCSAPAPVSLVLCREESSLYHLSCTGYIMWGSTALIWATSIVSLDAQVHRPRQAERSFQAVLPALVVTLNHGSQQGRRILDSTTCFPS